MLEQIEALFAGMTALKSRAEVCGLHLGGLAIHGISYSVAEAMVADGWRCQRFTVCRDDRWITYYSLAKGQNYGFTADRPAADWEQVEASNGTAT